MATRAMRLTLRRTGLSRNPEANDWVVIEEGVEIGRIYEDFAISRAEVRWFWAHNLPNARGQVSAHGRAATFEDAKAQFAAAVIASRARCSPSKDSDLPSG
jgi:hypothetical protein